MDKKMCVFLFLIVSLTVCCGQFFGGRQFQPNFFNNRNQRFFPRQNNFNNFNPRQQNNNFNRGGGGGGGGAVDNRLGSSEYHYSWKHAGFNTKWGWGGAVGYCQRLGGGWAPISINNGQEMNMVRQALSADNVSYIWTSGQRSGNGWRWTNGPFQDLGAWSRTGGARRAQPDNREGSENCLAVLNNFYNDGITWHDIGCSHEKPIICER